MSAAERAVNRAVDRSREGRRVHRSGSRKRSRGESRVHRVGRGEAHRPAWSRSLEQQGAVRVQPGHRSRRHSHSRGNADGYRSSSGAPCRRQEPCKKPERRTREPGIPPVAVPKAPNGTMAVRSDAAWIEFAVRRRTHCKNRELRNGAVYVRSRVLPPDDHRSSRHPEHSRDRRRVQSVDRGFNHGDRGSDSDNNHRRYSVVIDQGTFDLSAFSCTPARLQMLISQAVHSGTEGIVPLYGVARCILCHLHRQVAAAWERDSSDL